MMNVVNHCPFCGESKELYDQEGSEYFKGIYIGSYTSNKVTVSCWTCGGKMTEDIDVHWSGSFDPSLTDEENLTKVREVALKSCINKWNKRYG